MQRNFLRRGTTVAVLLASLCLAGQATATPTPTSGTLSPATPTLSFTGGFTASDPSGASCVTPNDAPTCDEYTLTVALPADYATTNPQAKLRIEMSHNDVEYDLYVYDADVNELGSSTDNPAIVELPAGSGTKGYLVDVQATFALGGTYTTTITLVPGTSTPTDSDGDGVVDGSDACPGTAAGTPVDSSGCAISAPPADDLPELTLHFHGNSDDGCTGVGSADVTACGGPFLKESGTLDSAPAAHFDYNEGSPTAQRTDTARDPTDANWTWKPTAPVIAQGYTVVNFWAQCNATCVLVGGTWDAYLFKNGTLVGTFELLEATPSTPNVPSLLSVHFTLPESVSLNGTTDTLTLKLEAHFSDTGQASSIFYDSTSACPGASAGPCDSVLILNAKAPPPPPPPPPTEEAAGLPPRYQIHVSPKDLGNEAGEPSVGINWATNHSMFISYTQALRQTYQEDVVPPLLPASCPALWEDKSGTLTTVNTLDPILFTDQATGRTFNSQLSGDNSLMEYTDDDGENWTIAQKGPPNGGADHQAVATGVYPEGSEPLTASWPADGPKRAVYYCSQSVAAAFCSRSDDGGATFGPGFVFKNTQCAAGALHGHVKVAPDGTVYVPDSSQCVLPTGETAEHVVAFASEDAGQTWEVRDIPFSHGGNGSDPSIGIATDGTVYMCYPNEDSTVHVAVSKDRGLTWTGGQDIGAAAGLVQTRFPQMIAGDPDRASCAFLGTTTAGNGDSLDFKGVWHGYQATTYDGGKSWHLVNVTPDDPIQGYGGVGPDGTNRNLLDFNDLQIDSQGRTYFAFADGCTGACVRDPANNAFEAKATIVRQTGGRSLFAKYDDVSAEAPVRRYNKDTAIEPAAACARQDLSSRSQTQSDVVWNAPDTGGSAITNYKVYRSDAADGPFLPVGDAGAQTRFADATTSPSVEKYYYRVEAYNAKGVAEVSNTIELAISADAASTCVAPGEIIILDSTGDAQGGDDMDIVFIGVAEPRDKPDDIVITEKIANFTAGIPPSTSFYVQLFPNLGNLYIALDSTEGPATFVYGHFDPDPAGQGFLIYTQDGTLPDSSYAADGTITFVVPRALLGDKAVGADLVGFDARSRLGAASANSRDTAGPSSYTIKGFDFCVDPNAPFALANLVVSTTHGIAPLGVTFTLSGTPAEGKALQNYSILFGDETGATPTTGSFAGGGSVQVSHTYTKAGVYRARLTVTDDGGNTSTNLAEQTVTVTAPGPGDSGSKSEDVIGNNQAGALPLLSLGVLALLGGLRRRRRY